MISNGWFSFGVEGCGGAAGRKRELLIPLMFLYVINDLSINKSKKTGLISADRRTKPTLVLTIPDSHKVVYSGFISSNVENCDKIRC